VRWCHTITPCNGVTPCGGVTPSHHAVVYVTPCGGVIPYHTMRWCHTFTPCGDVTPCGGVTLCSDQREASGEEKRKSWGVTVTWRFSLLVCYALYVTSLHGMMCVHCNFVHFNLSVSLQRTKDCLE